MQGKENPLSTRQKAITLNLATELYGTFSEIGAGQEVARWFFKVGEPPVLLQKPCQLTT